MNNPNKALFDQKNKNYKRQTLALNSIDLASSHDIFLSKTKTNFKNIIPENKIFDKNKIFEKEFPKKYLTTIQLTFNEDNRTKNQPNYEMSKLKKNIKNSEGEVHTSIGKNICLDNNLIDGPEIFMVNESKLKYKDIEIDLKENKIELKNLKSSEISNDKTNVVNASESFNSLDETSKTFVEDFFENKLGKNSSIKQEDSIKLDEQKKQEHQKSENDNLFLEKFFNYVPNTIQDQNDEFEQNGSTFSDKLNILNNFQKKNPVLGKIINNYILSNKIMENQKASNFIQKRTFLNCLCIQNGLICCLNLLRKTNDVTLSENCCNECFTFEQIEPVHLNDESFNGLIDAIDLLSNNEFKRFIRKFRKKNTDCACFLGNNNFRCCIDAIYENLKENNFKSLNPSFIKIKCCLKCVKPVENKHDNIEQKTKEPTDSVRSSLDELAELSQLDKQKDEIAKKSIQETFELFFQHEKSMEEEKMSSFGDNKQNSNLSLKKENLKIKPSKTETPRRSIIKDTSKQQLFKKTIVTKKSVSFEDPKHGFIRVEIPDWLEHLREPVYSNNFNKNLKEWKN